MIKNYSQKLENITNIVVQTLNLITLHLMPTQLQTMGTHRSPPIILEINSSNNIRSHQEIFTHIHKNM